MPSIRPLFKFTLLNRRPKLNIQENLILSNISNSSPKSAHKRTQPNDPAGMLEKLCGGYSSVSPPIMRSESKEMFDMRQGFQANIR